MAHILAVTIVSKGVYIKKGVLKKLGDLEKIDSVDKLGAHVQIVNHKYNIKLWQDEIGNDLFGEGDFEPNITNSKTWLLPESNWFASDGKFFLNIMTNDNDDNLCLVGEVALLEPEYSYIEIPSDEISE